MKTVSIVTGNAKENRFSCGADRVIIPLITFTNNKIIAIGNIIIAADRNMALAAEIPDSSKTLGFIEEPIGKIS
jgi:hypothetical protein